MPKRIANWLRASGFRLYASASFLDLCH